VEPFTELDPFAAARLRRVIRKERVHVVHAHTGHAVALAALSVLGTRAKMVLTRRVDARLRTNVGTRWKYARADGIIAISNAVADIMAQGGVPRSRIVIVPSGVDANRRVEPASPEVIRSLGVPPDTPWAVQVGALVRHKDPVNFVRGMEVARRQVPQIHGVLLGEGPLRPDVEAEIAKLGLGGAVHLAGHRNDADAILSAATVAVLASEEEGLGTALLDAMSFGVPIAATRAGGIPEIVEDGVSGLLSPIHDPESLGAAIARLATDRHLAQTIIRNASRRVMDFSARRTMERTVEVYRSVLGQR
jgi:glycosyltransferase involved in cell wall biosynthesis